MADQRQGRGQDAGEAAPMEVLDARDAAHEPVNTSEGWEKDLARLRRDLPQLLEEQHERDRARVRCRDVIVVRRGVEEVARFPAMSEWMPTFYYDAQRRGIVCELLRAWASMAFTIEVERHDDPIEEVAGV